MVITYEFKKKAKPRRVTRQFDIRCKRAVPYIAMAREAGQRSAKAMAAYINEQTDWNTHPVRHERRFSEDGMYRVLQRLRALGFDDGPDDLTTARQNRVAATNAAPTQTRGGHDP